MAIKLGISPIAWQNDDLPDITAGFTMEQALEESRAIGFLGVERGQRMPPDTAGLRAALGRHDLALCGGWYSGGLLRNDLEAEKALAAEQVGQFVDLGAPVMVYGECSDTVQGDRGTPVSARPTLDAEEMRAYAAKLAEFAAWTAGLGMPLSFHHHMGSVVESGEDVDRVMEGSGEALGLCYDTGHLRFGGADELAVLDRWGGRVNHVHFKDVRAPKVVRARAEDLSFLDAVIDGAFTVPGDGAIDFQPVADRLKAIGYDGWIVIEAEQDPALAPPMEYSRKGHEHTRAVCARAGLDLEERA